MLSFDKIVKRLWTKWWKIMFKEDIFDLIDPEKKPKYQNKLDKLIYNLKAKKYIISLKSWVYIIPDLEDKQLNTIDLLDKYYLQLLKKYITYHVWASYYISGKKSLEIQLKNYEVPEKIIIINRSIDKKVLLWEKVILFKTINGKDQNKKKINLYAKFSAYAHIKTVENIDFKVSSLELALLETALINESESWLEIGLITKTLKKYSKVLDYDVLREIGKYKYIMAYNRLKELSRNIDPEFSQLCLEVIKQNGWLFIGEGLRGC